MHPPIDPNSPIPQPCNQATSQKPNDKKKKIKPSGTITETAAQAQIEEV